ncbi:centrosome-associated protein 350-like [Amphibalanus amphitrite]|uniref:centrosome-associated protein 350-like n=1 Tax=Amphibalanus amphitrite TaxID=1232801 RepID=UPI001C90D447|nr:centrosome-associated protein 350-like [Amphibalanus amphitrite]
MSDSAVPTASSIQEATSRSTREVTTVSTREVTSASAREVTSGSAREVTSGSGTTREVTSGTTTTSSTSPSGTSTSGTSTSVSTRTIRSRSASEPALVTGRAAGPSPAGTGGRVVPIKSPLSPRLSGPAAAAVKAARRRHSSGSDDSVSFSQNDTCSDQSDVEGRIFALQEELKRRKVEAERLRREQRRKHREKLRQQEQSLRKQLEAYDASIRRAELELETQLLEQERPVRPVIKQPRVAERRAGRASAAAPAPGSAGRPGPAAPASGSSDTSASVSRDSSTETIVHSPAKAAAGAEPAEESGSDGSVSVATDEGTSGTSRERPRTASHVTAPTEEFETESPTKTSASVATESVETEEASSGTSVRTEGAETEGRSSATSTVRSGQVDTEKASKTSVSASVPTADAETESPSKTTISTAAPTAQSETESPTRTSATAESPSETRTSATAESPSETRTSSTVRTAQDVPTEAEDVSERSLSPLKAGGETAEESSSDKSSSSSSSPSSSSSSSRKTSSAVSAVVPTARDVSTDAVTTEQPTAGQDSSASDVSAFEPSKKADSVTAEQSEREAAVSRELEKESKAEPESESESDGTSVSEAQTKSVSESHSEPRSEPKPVLDKAETSAAGSADHSSSSSTSVATDRGVEIESGAEEKPATSVPPTEDTGPLGRLPALDLRPAGTKVSTEQQLPRSDEATSSEDESSAPAADRSAESVPSEAVTERAETEAASEGTLSGADRSLKPSLVIETAVEVEKSPSGSEREPPHGSAPKPASGDEAKSAAEGRDDSDAAATDTSLSIAEEAAEPSLTAEDKPKAVSARSLSPPAAQPAPERPEPVGRARLSDEQRERLATSITDQLLRSLLDESFQSRGWRPSLSPARVDKTFIVLEESAEGAVAADQPGEPATAAVGEQDEAKADALLEEIIGKSRARQKEEVKPEQAEPAEKSEKSEREETEEDKTSPDTSESKRTRTTETSSSSETKTTSSDHDTSGDSSITEDLSTASSESQEDGSTSREDRSGAGEDQSAASEGRNSAPEDKSIGIENRSVAEDKSVVEEEHSSAGGKEDIPADRRSPVNEMSPRDDEDNPAADEDHSSSSGASEELVAVTDFAPWQRPAGRRARVVSLDPETLCEQGELTFSIPTARPAAVKPAPAPAWAQEPAAQEPVWVREPVREPQEPELERPAGESDSQQRTERVVQAVLTRLLDDAWLEILRRWRRGQRRDGPGQRDDLGQQAEHNEQPHNEGDVLRPLAPRLHPPRAPAEPVSVQDVWMDDDFGLSESRDNELRRQEQEIEQEIRRLEELQKLQQLSGGGALYVREIPNKPPPPYREQAETGRRLSRADQQQRAARPLRLVPHGAGRVLPIVRRACDSLLADGQLPPGEGDEPQPSEQFLSGEGEPEDGSGSGSDGRASDGDEQPEIADERRSAKRQFRRFLFRLAAAAAQQAAAAGVAPPPPVWLRGRPARRLAARPPADPAALTEAVLRRTAVLLGYRPAAARENLMVRWARKRRDRVDEVLVRELQEEEADWINYDADAATVKEQLSSQLAGDLLTDATRQLMAVWRRRYVRQTEI